MDKQLKVSDLATRMVFKWYDEHAMINDDIA